MLLNQNSVTWVSTTLVCSDGKGCVQDSAVVLYEVVHELEEAQTVLFVSVLLQMTF